MATISLSLNHDLLVTPYPEDYGLILALARRLAKREVETQLKAEGKRLTLIPHRDIMAKANELLRQRPDIYQQAARIVAQHPEWRPKRPERNS